MSKGKKWTKYNDEIYWILGDLILYSILMK